MDNKEEYFKVKDYVYYILNGEFYMGRIHKINKNKMYCYWSENLKSLPNTIKEFNNIRKETHESFMYCNNDLNSIGKVHKIDISYNGSNEKIIKHIIVGNKTIVVISNPNGTYSKGISRCLPEDKFDEYIGFCIAYARAFYGTNDISPTELKDYSDEELVAELGKRLNEKEGK